MKRAYTNSISPFFIVPTSVRQQEEVLTYEKIGQMKARQESLVAEGKMEKPQIVRGFSAEDKKDFELGIKLEDYI